MNIIRCEKGHFFDEDTFDECPHCTIMARRGERHVSLEKVVFLESEQASVSEPNWNDFSESDEDTDNHPSFSGRDNTGMSGGGESSTSSHTQRIKALDMDSFAEFPDEAANTFGRDRGIYAEDADAYHPFSQREEEKQIDKVMQHFGLLKEDGPVTQKLQPSSDSVEEHEAGVGLPYEEFEVPEPDAGLPHGEFEEYEPGEMGAQPAEEGEGRDLEMEERPFYGDLKEDGPVTQRLQPFHGIQEGAGEGTSRLFVEFEEEMAISESSFQKREPEAEPEKEAHLTENRGEAEPEKEAHLTEDREEAEPEKEAHLTEDKEEAESERETDLTEDREEAESERETNLTEDREEAEPEREADLTENREEAESERETDLTEDREEAVLESRMPQFLPGHEEAGLSCRDLGDLPVGWAVCVKGPMKGEVYILKNGKNSIGRKDSMDISLSADQSLSDINHAFVEYDSGMKQFFALAGTSRGLCYVSDQLVLMKVPVRNYERISLGESELMLVQLCCDHFNWDDSQE